jgi:crotonobetainyl-CoA:carnitine CoA-transferase CaiB-like acyl-CoA transferase
MSDPNTNARLPFFFAGVMEKWGLGPADLPHSLVYTRISGYGQTGPKAQLPGYASVCEAFGGLRCGTARHGMARSCVP